MLVLENIYDPPWERKNTKYSLGDKTKTNDKGNQLKIEKELVFENAFPSMPINSE